jgi:quinol monooxygenase YgiN
LNLVQHGVGCADPDHRTCVFVGRVEVIVNTTRITVSPEKRTELLQTIGRLLEPIKGAKGCRTFRYYLDTTDENSSLLMSEWETESDYSNCFRSDDFAILRGAITVLSIRSIDSEALVTSQRCRDPNGCEYNLANKKE